MPDIAVIGGLVVAVVALLCVADFAQGSSPVGSILKSLHGGSTGSEDGKSSRWAERFSGAGIQEPKCSETNPTDKFNCIVQIRSLHAAETQAQYAIVASAIAAAALICAAIAAAVGYRTVRVMRQSAERQLRAYVGLFGGQITWDGAYTITADATLRNTGQTPGRNFMTWAQITICRRDNRAVHGCAGN